MDSDTDSESVIDGDEDPPGSPSSSQSTNLFDDEDEGEMMEISDEETSTTSLGGGASHSNMVQSRVTEGTSNRSRIEPRLQSSIITIGDHPGEDRSIQGGSDINRSRTNPSRTASGNSNLLSNNSTNQIEIQNHATTSVIPSEQTIASTQMEPAMIRTGPAGASNQTVSLPNPSSIPSESSSSSSASRENLRSQSDSHTVVLNSPAPSETNRLVSTTAVAEESRRDSLSDFKLPAKDAAKTAYDEDTDSDDESQTCIICYEPWSNSGKHRLASLKCGHLFGSSCIQKWLKGQGGKCPQCNTKAKKSDIRVIFAKALKAIDTSERDKALKELEKEKELRRKTEIEKAQIMLKYQMAMEEVNRMRSQVKQSSSSHSSQPGSSTSQRSACSLTGNYAIEKTISVSADGNSRILSYDYANHCLVASVPSPNQVLFAGFGVKKISALMSWKTNQYIPMHSKPIRGMAFNGRNDGLLLTGSMDKTLKITSLTSSTVVQSYNTTAPVWSCCWDSEDVNYLFAGLSNGQIVVYDTRNTSEEVLTLNREGSKHPIVAMNYVPKSEGSRFPCSGILVGTLSNCSFWEQTSPLEFKPHILPLEGNCISLSFEPSTRHCLASFRPNKTYPSMRHVMCELLSPSRAGQVEPEVKCNPIQSFFGGSTVKLLARSTLFRRPDSDDHLLVAAGDEGSSALDLWDSNSGSKVQHLMAGATILDVCPFRFSNSDYLAALSEKVIKLYKWQP